MLSDFLELLDKTPDPLLAAVGVLISTAILEILRTVIARSREQRDDKRSEQDDLREDIWKLKEEIHRIEEERDKWRDQYYEVRERILIVQAQLTVAEAKLRDRNDGMHPPPVQQ